MKPATRAVLAYLDKVEPVLERLTYFELLDVAPDADDAAIQSAYHAIASRMHPDRHRAELSPEQYERLNIVYGRIAEAYRLLRNADERTRYTRGLARTAKTAPGQVGDEAAAIKLLSPKAQRLYRRAKAALRTGDTTSAVLNLKMALRANPSSALLVDALARVKSTH